MDHPCISHLFPGADSRQEDVGKALDGKDGRRVPDWNPDPNVKWGAMVGHCRAGSEENSWSALGRDHSQTSGNHTLEEDQLFQEKALKLAVRSHIQDNCRVLKMGARAPMLSGSDRLLS